MLEWLLYDKQISAFKHTNLIGWQNRYTGTFTYGQFFVSYHIAFQNLHERISANISHITQSYLNSFVTLRDNLKLQIMVDFILQMLNGFKP